MNRLYILLLTAFLLSIMSCNNNYDYDEYERVIDDFMASQEEAFSNYRPVEYMIISSVDQFGEYAPDYTSFRKILDSKINCCNNIIEAVLSAKGDAAIQTNLLKLLSELSELIKDVSKNSNKIIALNSEIDREVSSLLDKETEDEEVNILLSEFKSLSARLIYELEAINFSYSMIGSQPDSFIEDINEGLYVNHKFMDGNKNVEAYFKLNNSRTRVEKYQRYTN